MPPGRSPDRQALRLRAAVPGRRLAVWWPAALTAEDRRLSLRPSHKGAPARIGGNRARTEAAMAARGRATRPRPPFDRLTPAEDC